MLHALDASNDLLLLLDAAGSIRYANAAAARELGIETLGGQQWTHTLDEGSRGKAATLLRDARSGPTAPFELHQTRSDGSIVTIEYRALPEGDGQTLLIGRSLTETVATTQRLIALNQRLNALFAIAASARSLILAELLEQTLQITINELHLRAGAVFLADDPIAIASARPLPLLQPDQLQLIAQIGFTAAFEQRLRDPARRTAFWNTNIGGVVQAVKNGTADEIGIAPGDLLVDVGPLLTVAATPLRNDDRLFGWLYVLTDRYRALADDELDLLQTIGNLLGAPVENARLHDALVNARGRLEAVLAGIDSGVLLVDQGGSVRYTNPQLGALLGVHVGAWLGRARDDVMPTTLLPLHDTTRMLHDDLWELGGTPRRVLRRHAAPIADTDGQPLGSIEVYTDITQLQETTRLRDEFVAAAAHDLKTPVTAIKGYAQIARRLARRLDDDKLAQQLEMINARSDELTLLMDGLLDMSRIQAGRLHLDPDPFTVRELLDDVIRHFDFDLRRRQRALTVDLPPEPIDVEWDRTRMTGVLINLVGNALKYSPDGGSIAIGVQQRGPCVEINVTDHGIGIPAAERDRIFERFYRVRSTVDHGFKGSGIGLYISQFIVRLHGGRIWATDALHGEQGTTLHVALPRVAPVADET